jgi:glycerol-3-phosphate dehydrogenase subunit B
LAAELYSPPEYNNPIYPFSPEEITTPKFAGSSSNVSYNRPVDLLVIGGGLSGLITAWKAAINGQRVSLITKGWSSTHWQTGCIDFLGYSPMEAGELIESPEISIPVLLKHNPDHPYSRINPAGIQAAIAALIELSQEYGYPLHGNLHSNWLLPTGVGAIRPTCLAPETMIAGDTRTSDPMLIVGFEQLVDFFPELISVNLQEQGILANHLMLDLPELRQRRFVYPTTLAYLFDTPKFRQEVAAQIKSRLGQSRRVGFPAVLGINRPLEAKRDLERQLNCPVFEIPSLPPSIPGIRLHNLLISAIRKSGGQVFEGMQAINYESKSGYIRALHTEAAARKYVHPAKTFVLATGGILGGGIISNPDGSLQETIFDLHVKSPPERRDWHQRNFFDPKGHPIFQSGIPVDDRFRPIDQSGLPYFPNLLTVGTTLAGGDFLRECSQGGVDLVSGYLAAQNLPT